MDRLYLCLVPCVMRRNGLGANRSRAAAAAYNRGKGECRMNMFTKLLETLGNNFWLIIILCLEVILAVWLLCFARGKKKNRAAELRYRAQLLLDEP